MEFLSTEEKLFSLGPIYLLPQQKLKHTCLYFKCFPDSSVGTLKKTSSQPKKIFTLLFLLANFLFICFIVYQDWRTNNSNRQRFNTNTLERHLNLRNCLFSPLQIKIVILVQFTRHLNSKKLQMDKPEVNETPNPDIQQLQWDLNHDKVEAT